MVDTTSDAPIRAEDSHVVDYEDVDYRTFWVGKHMQIYNQHEKRVVASWVQEKLSSFIDVGCGPGRMIPLYKEKMQQTVLVDFAKNNLNIIQKEHPDEKFICIQADACNLPFRDNCFSGGLSIRLIQNVFMPEKMFMELGRILIPGAKMTISYFNRRNLLRIFRFGRSCFKKGHEVTHQNMCGTHPAYFKQLVKNAGMQVLKTQGTGMFYQITYRSEFIKRIVTSLPLFANGLSFCCSLTDRVMGALTLALWQFALVQKDGRFIVQPVRNLFDMLRCPKCKSLRIHEQADAIICEECSAKYPVENGIYNFII